MSDDEFIFDQLQMDKTIEDARKFIGDFYAFLERKGQKQELKNFILEFTLSKKREEEFTCKMCSEQNLGVKYTCTHCGIFYCQKCFDVNKFMKKHPHVFIADTGTEGDEVKTVFNVIRNASKSSSHAANFSSKPNPNPQMNQPGIAPNDNSNFAGNQALMEQLRRDNNQSNNHVSNPPNNQPNANRPNNQVNLNRANRMGDYFREEERRKRQEEEDRMLALRMHEREMFADSHHGAHHIDENYLHEMDMRRHMENNRREDPEMDRIRKVMESLDRSFHVRNKYSEEAIIAAIKYANFDECKAYEKLLTQDTAHL